jgi:carboxypeptidase C (cathepsin A)
LESLGICGQSGQDAFSGTAGGCITIPNFDARDTFDYSGALGKALDSGIPVTLYYGKTDTACNYVGGYAMASTLPWKGSVAFTETPLNNLEIAGAVAGEVKAFGGLTWIQVESAGHMVPLDQPPASLVALNTILDTLSAKHKKQ